MKTKHLTRIAIMIVLSVVVNIFERYLPSISFIPGAKWGFANIIILLGTIFLNFNELLTIGALRSIFSSFVLGTFLSIQFYLSISGALASACTMYLFSKKGPFSFVGISVLGSVASNSTQILVYSLFAGSRVLGYLPVLMIFSVLTGSITGILSLMLKEKIKKLFLES